MVCFTFVLILPRTVDGTGMTGASVLVPVRELIECNGELVFVIECNLFELRIFFF